MIAPLVVLAGVGIGLLVAPRAHTTPPMHAPPPTKPAADTSQPSAQLPAPHNGFHIPRAHQLTARQTRDITRWAPVLHATAAHARPAANSPVVTAVAAATPENTTNLVVADGETTTRNGQTWVHAELAVLPDGRTGWIPRTALGGWSFVDTRLVVNRETERLTLYRDGTRIFQTRVGVGKPSTPTPAGHFYIRDRLTAFASPEYGPLAFGTSARSEFETDWPAGGFIGIHGTDEPQLIPGQISHGCIRLRNAAILKLGRLLPVGTPVTIQ